MKNMENLKTTIDFFFFFFKECHQKSPNCDLTMIFVRPNTRQHVQTNNIAALGKHKRRDKMFRKKQNKKKNYMSIR